MCCPLGRKEDGISMGEPADCPRLITEASSCGDCARSLNFKRVGRADTEKSGCQRQLWIAAMEDIWPAALPLPFGDAVLDPSVVPCNRLFMTPLSLLGRPLLGRPPVKVDSWAGD